MHGFVKGTFIFAGGVVSGLGLAKIAMRAAVNTILDDLSHERRAEGYKPNYAHTDVNVEDILFNSLSDAKEVIGDIKDILKKYGVVTLADVCDLAGVACHYSDYKIGWVNVDDFKVRKCENTSEYYISCPKPRRLED